MLRFFRQIRKQFVEQDNIRKYILYAVGEIFLVVIGILIALQVNNWNENQALRSQEAVYLQFILDDLVLQKEENSTQRTAITAHISAEEKLIEHISNRFQVSKDQRNDVKFLLSTLLVGRTYGAYEATFLDLTSSGNIALISNQILKNQIIQHYQVQKRDRDVINNNTLNTFMELWTKLINRDLIVISPTVHKFVSDYSALEFNPSLAFLDEKLFENLSKEENMILIQNVLAYKVTTTKIAIRFIDESDTRIDQLIEAIEFEMEYL
ncbi:MAG: hypothetical protein U5K71_11330 [Gracilimonas sp.]|nr:hypothetical protein [Gracilimonas sp.]